MNNIGKRFVGSSLVFSVFLFVGTAGLAACSAKEESNVPVANDYTELMQPFAAADNDAVQNVESVNSKQAEEIESDNVLKLPENVSEDTDEAVEETEDDSVVTITISAAGDVTLGNYLGQEYDGSFDEMYDTVDDGGYFFQNVYDIFSSDDMTIVNLEGPLTNAEEIRLEKEYVIKGRPEYAKLLTLGSIEAAGMANNHILDYKEEGLADTVKAVEDEGIAYAYDGNLGLYEVKGIKIGFVAISQVSRGNAMEKTLKNGIEKLKEENADIILALCHWGIEREYYPEEYQQYLGHLCIDWGADVVLGSHTHCLQGIENYNGSYIVYSLGNFCFGGNRNPSDKDTMIFQQTYTFVDGEKQEGTDIHVIPCSVSSVTYRNDYQPTPLTGSDSERVINRLNEYSKDFGVAFDYDGNLK
jgi:poly-gamma-glutamate synthesis protein (capsule biosynthesis protein)